jgi:predicted nucleic acid-binding protein
MIQATPVMIADYKILLDACVMANYGVCDLYLRLAEKPRLFSPKWSQDILDEVHSTHVEKLDWDERLATSFQNAVKDAFPEAMITDYQELIPIMTNDEKDRHVLAAAVRDKLNLIITFNLKDFKAKDLSKWNIEALHPQDYLLTLYSMKPGIVMMKLAKIAQKKEQDLEDVILDFGVALPKFSKRLLEDMGEDTTY